MTDINTNQIADRIICVILIACATYAALKIAEFIIDIIASYRMEKANPPEYELTPQGRKECELYLKELRAKQKEILDAKIDTAHETSIDYTPGELLEDVLQFGIDEYGDAYNSYGVTDHYASALYQTILNGYIIYQHDGNGYLQWFDSNGKEYFDTNGNGSIADEIAALPPATYNY